MVFDGMLIAIIIGFIRGGSFKRFADIQFKLGWIFPLLLVLQLAIFYFQNKVAWVGEISNYHLCLFIRSDSHFYW